jgi:formylglycine-generating enzyme required for sulfatase activity
MPTGYGAVMDASTCDKATTQLLQEVRAARAHTDALFRLVAPEILYERTIPDRHRLIFYIGHFDAFDWNQLGRGLLDRPSFDPTFDRLFEAGIDPAPGQAAAIDQPSDWPALDAVLRYVERTRRELDECWDEVPVDRILTALEHRWMHAETVCYLLHQIEPRSKHRPGLPPGASTEAGSSARRPHPWVEVPAGAVTLGQAPDEFGWDNEFPQHRSEVTDFEISRHKLTNGGYLRFVVAGGPPPHFWRERNGTWWLRRMFDEVPLPLDAPVYLTHRQATAYAAWAGLRLPTEAEWQRAAYGDGEQRYPWGDAAPDAERANLDFVAWDPLPVTAHPLSATPLGVEQMAGNGWEWTATPFAAFEGFSPRPYYPGYSANFFDGEHYVLKGASPRTAQRLARPSFRNWFRAEYPYVYSTVRLARS